jgi:hypothetical protein
MINKQFSTFSLIFFNVSISYNMFLSLGEVTVSSEISNEMFRSDDEKVFTKIFAES